MAADAIGEQYYTCFCPMKAGSHGFLPNPYSGTARILVPMYETSFVHK